MRFEPAVIFLLTVIIVLLTVLVAFSVRTTKANESVYSLLQEPFYDEGTGADAASEEGEERQETAAAD